MKEDGKSSGNAEIGFQDLRHQAFGDQDVVGAAGRDPAISAALKGTEEMAAQQRLMLNVYVELMCDALRPFSGLEGERLRPVCVGLLGAAEALASEAQAGAISQQIATSVLTSLIVKAVADGPQQSWVTFQSQGPGKDDEL